MNGSKSNTDPDSSQSRVNAIVDACAALLGLATVLAFCFFLARYRYTSVPEDDCYAYLLMARSFSQFKWPEWEDDLLRFATHPYVSIRENQVMVKYAPGMPLLMAPGYWIDSVQGSLAVIALVSMCGAFAYWRIVRILFDPLAAFICAFMWLSAPCTLAFASYPLTHSMDVAFAVLAIYFALRYGHNDRPIDAMALGLFLGLMPVVRPTDLLLWPAAFAAYRIGSRKRAECMKHQSDGTVWSASLAGGWLVYGKTTLGLMKKPGAWLEAVHKLNCAHLTFLIAWLAPLSFFALYNWTSFGVPWRTGYAMSGEQSAFALNYIPGQLRHAIEERSFLLENRFWVIVIIGLLFALHSRSGVPALILLWAAPTILVYTAYYFLMPGTGYMRFFLLTTPAFILSVGFLTSRLARWPLVKLLVLIASLVWFWQIPPESLQVLRTLNLETPQDHRDQRTTQCMLSNARDRQAEHLCTLLIREMEVHQRSVALYSDGKPLWSCAAMPGVTGYAISNWLRAPENGSENKLNRGAPYNDPRRKARLREFFSAAAPGNLQRHFQGHVRTQLVRGLIVFFAAHESSPALLWLSSDTSLSMKRLSDIQRDPRMPAHWRETYQVFRVELKEGHQSYRPDRFRPILTVTYFPKKS